MRAVVIAAVLALGSSAAAQTPPPTGTNTAPTGAQTNVTPVAPNDAPRAAPAPAPMCSVDGDCPGALFCVSGQCKAQSPTGAAKDVTVTPAKSGEKDTQFGINLDAGVPDGVALGFMYRPIHFLRLGAAAAYNGIGFGGRGMIVLAPFNFFITPTLSVEVGRFLAADAGPILAQSGLAIPPEAAPLLQEVGYDFGNAHLGLEIGAPQHFIFYLRAGGSYIQTTIKNFGAVVQQGAGDPTLEVQDLNVRVTVPSLKLGLAAFF